VANNKLILSFYVNLFICGRKQCKILIITFKGKDKTTDLAVLNLKVVIKSVVFGERIIK
jgi:hypothetical protein